MIRPEDRQWLGNDLKTWSQSIRNGYIRSFIIFAFHYLGVFKALKEKPKSVEELANECNINAFLLEGILNFLAFADQIIEKKNGKFSLAKEGKDWLFTDPVIAMSYGAIGAYSCLLYELVPSLREEKRYGKDFVRRGDLIAVGSHATGKANYPWVVKQMSRLGVRCVADLGCGSADILISFCSLDPKLKGVGIDISVTALEEAKHRVKKAGLKDRIRLVEGDITNPRSFVTEIQDVDAFNGIMVFHEFLRDGEDKVVQIFRKMKELFPGRYLFIGEFDRISDEEFEKMPMPERIHPLFYQFVIHPLTWQGQPIEKEKWLDIFKRAGLSVIKVEDKFPFRLVEFVLKF